jgi:hypothetical protein
MLYYNSKKHTEYSMIWDHCFPFRLDSQQAEDV